MNATTYIWNTFTATTSVGWIEPSRRRAYILGRRYLKGLHESV
jgi:hypothetical protein